MTRRPARTRARPTTQERMPPSRASKKGAPAQGQPARHKVEEGKAGASPPADRLSAPPEPTRQHRHRTLDRATMASLARLTGGISPHAVIEAWTDLGLHLARAPGRQMELAERAATNAL